jgi:mRNA interferase RelE/StbE
VNSAWKIEIKGKALKQLKQIDRQSQLRIKAFLTGVVVSDPRRQGKALQGQLKGFWRYRVGSYRLICLIQDERLVVLVLKIAPRGNVYRGN